MYKKIEAVFSNYFTITTIKSPHFAVIKVYVYLTSVADYIFL